MMKKGKKVLVCPLNWGLGHAARCIPLIHELIRQRNTVMIAGNGASIDLLKETFPSLQFLKLDGAEIRYSKKGFSFITMLLQLPGMIWCVFTEHSMLQRLIKQYNIDVVISDNRYGLWSKKVKCILITHQLYIKLPQGWNWLERGVNKVNHFFIRKYQKCWVPDLPAKPDLSGELSHSNINLSNIRFIGILSRFDQIYEMVSSKKYEVLVILSGPEPQRSILENILIEKLAMIDKDVMFVRGKPDDKETLADKANITFYNHLSKDALSHHLRESKYIICRSGYSSLMDLAALGRSAIIIPTPGQAEQEYLAHYHHANGNHFMLQQEGCEISGAFSFVEKCKPLHIINKFIPEVISEI